MTETAHSALINANTLKRISVGLIVFSVTTISVFSPVLAQETPTVAPSDITQTQPAQSVPVNTQPSLPVQTDLNPNQATPDSLKLTAIPPRLGEDFSLTAKPGQTLQVEVKIKNISLQPQPIKTVVEDFIVGEDGEQPVPVSEETTTQWSLAKWITLSPGSQILQPNQTAEVQVLIEVPEDALPGGHYAMIMHEPSNDFTLQSTSAGVSQRVGTLLYLLVEGPINQEAYITNLTAPQLVEYGPVPLSFMIDNRSDIHIRPNTVIEIRNMFSQEVGVIELEPKNIFPYTQRKYETNWDRVWGLGKYTATVVSNYGTQGQITRAITTFWIIPYKLILAGLVTFSALGAILIVIRRHFAHRRDLKSQQIEMLEQKVAELESQKSNKFSDDQR